MCGIIGYVGPRHVKQLLLDALQRLEYRGYDSAGIVLDEADGLDYIRTVGNLQFLLEAAGPNGSHSTHGLGHTRWATHGKVSVENAHPLAGCDEREIAVVLNGIIENYRELRAELVADGHTFTTETDAETVAHLVESNYEGDLVEAVRRTYGRLEGHFAFVVIHHDQPDLLVGTRRQVPLVVGVGDGEMFLASNTVAFLQETRNVQFPDEGDIVAIRPEGVSYTSAIEGGQTAEHETHTIEWDEEAAEKGGYETFMLKEIYEQPEAVRETIGER
ncbi:MAG: glutamine--fructose-6-phosphate transaminase (isomerizing), partial [Gaiellaceae bacterium]